MITCNDDILRHHIMNTAVNATYLSPVTQNALTEAIAKIIQRQIVAELCDAKFFSLLADETTDFPRQEELIVSATDPGRCWSGLNKHGRARLRWCRCHVCEEQCQSETHLRHRHYCSICALLVTYPESLFGKGCISSTHSLGSHSDARSSSVH